MADSVRIPTADNKANIVVLRDKNGLNVVSTSSIMDEFSIGYMTTTMSEIGMFNQGSIGSNPRYYAISITEKQLKILQTSDCWTVDIVDKLEDVKAALTKQALARQGIKQKPEGRQPE